PIRAALLVESFASGSVFVSVWPHNDSFFRGAGGELLLSVARRAAFLSGHKYRGLAGCSRDAFPERRAGRNGSWRGAWVCLDNNVRIAWQGLDWTVRPGKLYRLLSPVSLMGGRASLPSLSYPNSHRS